MFRAKSTLLDSVSSILALQVLYALFTCSITPRYTYSLPEATSVSIVLGVCTNVRAVAGKIRVTVPLQDFQEIINCIVFNLVGIHPFCQSIL